MASLLPLLLVMIVSGCECRGEKTGQITIDRSFSIGGGSWDSGTTIAAVSKRIRAAGGEPVTAVLHYKPGKSRVEIVPDIFIVETDDWVIYPFKAGK